MARSKLKPELLDALVEITGKDKQRLWEKISRIISRTGLTHNAAAHLIAMQNDKSFMGKLNENDKASWRDYQASNRVSSTIIVRQSQRGKANGERSRKKPIINYKSTNPSNSYYVNEHIRELTDAYYAGCYTAVFILFRKIVENLIIDILKAKFPSERDLVYR